MADSYVIRQGTERNTNPMFMEIMAKDLTELAKYASRCTPGSLGYLEDATVYRLGTQGTWVKVGEDVPSRLNAIDADIAELQNTGVDTTARADIAGITTQLTEKTGYGVISGLVVSAQSTPDMTVKVSAGVAYMSNNTRYAPAAVASLAVTAADATNPRIDIVYLSSEGAVSYLAGTAAATPAAPATPTGGLLLAEINVAANATTIVAANITARKKNLWSEDWITPTLLNGWASVIGETIQYRKHANGLVELRGSLRKSELSGIAFYLPLEYRPQNTLYAGATSKDAPARLLITRSDGTVTPDKGTPADRITLTGVFFSTN